MPSSSLLVTNTASESVSISSEASTSLPLSKPATVALARPDPIEDASSSKLIGLSNSFSDPSGNFIFGISSYLFSF